MSKVLRPGSNFHTAEDLPSRSDPAQSKAVETIPGEWIIEYDYHTPASVAKERYENDPVYRHRVDLLEARRSQNDAY